MGKYNKVAAKWWADKLRYVEPDNFKSGGNSETDNLMMILATMFAIDSKTSGKNIDLFEKELSKTIKKNVKAYGSITLSVNYAPDKTLWNIAQKTGVSRNRFPWKTTMWIKKGKVSVTVGNSKQVIFNSTK